MQGLDESVRIEVTKQIAEAMKTNVYLVIPGDKIFTYSGTRIIDTIRTSTPDVATVEMRPIGLHKLKITVTLLTPLFKVTERQALTEDGILFLTNKDLSTYPKIILASSTQETIKIKGIYFTKVLLGDERVDATFLKNLVQFSGKVSSLIFPVETILVERTGDVTLLNKEGTSKVLFLQTMDQKKVWSTLVSAIDTDPLKSKLANEKDKLEYLDVRYGNKVFYRFSDMMLHNNGTDHILDNHATTTQAATSSSR